MSEALQVILACALVTYMIRLAPHLLSGVLPEDNAAIQSLMDKLPLAVMAVLVVYCFKDVVDAPVSLGVPSLVAGTLCVVFYRRTHKMMPVLILSTAVYMCLIRLI